MMNKRTFLYLAAVILCLFFAQANGVVIFSDSMTTTTNGWNEGSDATNETGDSTGGIRAVDYGSGPIIQMNSWWDTANWTSIWKDTGITIQADTVYKFTASINSFSSGDNVTLVLQDVDNSWTNIVDASLPTTAGYYSNCSVSFDSADYPSAVGHSLGIAVEAGWWNNLGLEQVMVEQDPEGQQSVVGNLALFDTSDPGVTKTLDFWGVDQTWVSSDNMDSTIENIGYDDTDAVRINMPKNYELEYDQGDSRSFSGCQKALSIVLWHRLRVFPMQCLLSRVIPRKALTVGI